jgi:hypothetical protein
MLCLIAGALKTLYDGDRPDGYSPMKKQARVATVLAIALCVCAVARCVDRQSSPCRRVRFVTHRILSPQQS